MKSKSQRIAELEWANYAATLSTAQITPNMEVILRDDVIMTSSDAFPTPDANHACLLRATPQAVDDLIAEVIDYFQSQGLPVTVYISSACRPSDLPERLSRHGFVRQEEKEAWMVLEHLSSFEVPSPSPGIAVKIITEEEVLVFADVFLRAFGMPADFVPLMAQLMKHSVELPGVYHYIAWRDEKPVGTCSLLCHGSFGVLGSAGVLPTIRGKGTATNLAIEAVTEAKRQGVETLMLQTTANTLLERLLRISGFKKVFTRTCYTLPE